MKRLALIAVLAALAPQALAQVDRKAESELQASYKKVTAALKKKDIKALMNHMTPDATMKEMGKTYTRAEFEPMLKQQIQMVDLQSSEIKFSKLTVKGDQATAEYTETTKAKMKGPDGKVGLMEAFSKYKAIFKKMSGEWKLKYSETIGTPTMKLNGKPVTVPTAP